MPNAHDPHDTDGSQHASHHTLGTGALQAYPGSAGAILLDAVNNPKTWNGTGQNALLNPSFEAWNNDYTSDPGHYPDGIPYNWGFFWGIGTRGVIRKCRSTDGVPSRDQYGIRWEPVDPAPSNQYIYSEGIKVVPGETHTFGIWAKTANNVTPMSLELWYFWDTSANPNPGPFSGTGVTARGATTLTTEWQQIQADITIPATAGYVTAYYILNSSGVATSFCEVDQAFYNKSNASLWAASGFGTWNDPGINMVLNPEFDVFAAVGGLPYSYSAAYDATYPGSFVKNSTVSRTMKNCLLYTKGATVGPTATDELYCDNTLKKMSGDYLVSVWVLASGNNAANPLAGIEALIISATNASFTAGVVVSNVVLSAINAVGAIEVGAWIKYTARVTAPSGGPYFKFGLRFTNNPATSQGWYFTQFTAYKCESETLPATVNGYQGTNASITSTTFVAGSPGLEVSFVAPPSGNIFVTIYCDISMSGTSAGVGSFEIRTASGGGGSVFLAADDTRSCLFAGASSRIAASGPRMPVSGLTPGTTYWARTMGRQGAGTGTGCTFNVRRLIIESSAN